MYKRQDERFVDEHTLTTSISRIRSKIESDGGAPYIKTCLLYTSASDIREALKKDVVAKQLELLRMRNTHKAFEKGAVITVAEELSLIHI